MKLLFTSRWKSQGLARIQAMPIQSSSRECSLAYARTYRGSVEFWLLVSLSIFHSLSLFLFLFLYLAYPLSQHTGARSLDFRNSRSATSFRIYYSLYRTSSFICSFHFRPRSTADELYSIFPSTAGLFQELLHLFPLSLSLVLCLALSSQFVILNKHK